MTSVSIVRQLRGPRKENFGDRAAVPLMTARILFLVKSDALDGKVIDSTLGYFNQSLAWFHASVIGRPFPFMLPKEEDKKGTVGRRPTYFRKEAGLFVDQLITLSVAGRRTEAAQITSAIRIEAEAYLTECYFALLKPHEKYESPDAFQKYLGRLRAGESFSQLFADRDLTDSCFADLALDHELRLRDFAMLTIGLCS